MLPSFILLPMAAIVGGTALLLLWRSLRAGRARSLARATYFNECLPLFSTPTKRTEPHGFARMSGRYKGHLFDLQALPDTLSYRKLPALWVMVSLPEEMPVTSTLDLMQRPGGNEVFSHFSKLPVQISTPPGISSTVTLRTDNPAHLPDPSLLQRHGIVFESPRTKELLISPKGLRIVFLAEEADRSRYLLFRDAELGMTPLPAAVLRKVLDRLLDIEADLRAIEPEKPRNIA